MAPKRESLEAAEAVLSVQMEQLQVKQEELKVVGDKLEILNDDLENKQHEKKVLITGIGICSLAACYSCCRLGIHLAF